MHNNKSIINSHKQRMRKHKNKANCIFTGGNTINRFFKRLHLLLDMSNFKCKMPSEFNKKNYY